MVYMGFAQRQLPNESASWAPRFRLD